MGIIVDTPEGIEFVRLLSRRGALSLELKGMHRRGQSAYSICKQVYGFKGSRERVLEQVEELVEKAMAARREGNLFLTTPKEKDIVAR